MRICAAIHLLLGLVLTTGLSSCFSFDQDKGSLDSASGEQGDSSTTPAGAGADADKAGASIPARLDASETFTFRLPGEPETLDWNLAHTMIETYILMNLMEGLVSVDSNLGIQPALAEKWEVSDDRKVWTFHLRDDVYWSDGVALQARDFVFSWKRLLAPATAASYAYFLFDIVGAQEYNAGKLKDFTEVGITAKGTHTLEIRLKKPVDYFLYIPGFWVTFPLREDIVRKYGSSWAKPGRMVTLGPYSLAQYVLNSRIVLKANPKYYRFKGNIEWVVAQIVNDNSTALKLYETGKLDFLTDISTLDLERMAGRSDLKTYPYLKTGYLGFSVQKHPANLAGFRRAVAMAIDKSKMGLVLQGGQTAASTFVPPQLPGYSANAGLAFNPEKARQELKRSGVLSGGKVVVDLLTPNWDKNITLAEYLESELKKNLGIQVNIQPLDHKSFRVQVDLHTNPLFFGSWGADFPHPDNFLSVFTADSGNNRTQWKNSRYDQLVLRAREGGRTANESQKLYLSAQKILLEEEAVIVPLYYEPNKALVRARIKGLTLNPLNYLLLREVQLEY